MDGGVDESEEKPVRRKKEGSTFENPVHGARVLPDPSPRQGHTGLSIRFFGPPDIRIDAKPIHALRSRRGYWLLALLTLRHGREVEREWLAGNLWPESNQARALASLRRTLTDLRSALGDEAARLTSATPHSLRLDLNGAFADVVEFDVDASSDIESDLEHAVSLYAGPLLEGCLEEWVIAERNAREQSCLTALERLGSYARENGDFARAIKHLRKAVSIDPFRESAQRSLMEALAMDGNHAAVALVYRELRDSLRREMNADPSPETAALFQRLRGDGRKSADSVGRRPSAVPKDRGGIPGCLPQPITSFIGRENEVEEVRHLIRSSRLVTITGTGGVGKTRLSIHIAGSLTADYPDGIWFADLAPLRNADLVPRAVAGVLELVESKDVTPRDALCDALFDKQLLLILDNCEHLVEAASILSRSLMEECPGLRILTTSRQPLGIPGETVWRAPSLDIPEPKNLPPADEGLAFVLPRYSAVRLFVERATSAMPSFSLNDNTAPAVLRIVQRLDGIPLAIELAAARIRALSAQQIASRLDDRFRLLTRGDPASMARQKTLQGAIEWSYDLLTESEQALFRRLGVFSGGWSLEAAESIFNIGLSNLDCESGSIQNPKSKIQDGITLDLLSDLIDKSLAIADEDVVGERRYRMLETAREYALERLRECGEEEEANRRHFVYYMGLAEEGSSNPAGEIPQEWLDRLEADHDNIRTALHHAPTAEDLANLTRYMYWFWNLRGYWHEAGEWLKRSLEEYRTEDLTRAKVLSSAGIMAWRRGDLLDALRYLDEALGIYVREDDIPSQASTLGNMGLAHGDLGDYSKATECHERSLRICRSLGDERGVAARLTNLGLVELYESKYPAARDHLMEAISIYREVGATRGLGAALVNIGLVYLRLGDLSSARKCNEECVNLCRELSLKSNLGYSLQGLGMVELAEGGLAKARGYFRESLGIRTEMAEQKALADTITSIGDLKMKEGDGQLAVKLWSAGMRFVSKLGARISPAEQRDCNINEAAGRRVLGDIDFDEAWAEGWSWSTDQALAEAERAVR